eukprot:TRINITY_DN428_c0_g2_i1.p1 TRINITY_DN428_c0_g2~~TRINITY_DN428_c0_g2_i1.p1  ORF type:complete len:286 (-),score=63.85 TRINITY_DN428_c0_g2_i1:78-935(-)
MENLFHLHCLPERKRNARQFKKMYEIKELIGEGGQGSVYRCVHRKTGNFCAVKIVSVKGLAKKELKKIDKEIHFLKVSKSCGVVELIETFKSSSKFYIVMELIKGGELFEYVSDNDHLSEEETAIVMKQILSSLKVIHSRGVVHRDLKLENILITDTTNLTVKISDFGLATQFNQRKLKKSCGTPEYVAPEVLISQEYDNRCDLWSLGVIAYMLLSGYPPFYGDDTADILERVVTGEYTFKIPIWEKVSEEGKSFVMRLLVSDPDHRAGIEECMESNWMKKFMQP